MGFLLVASTSVLAFCRILAYIRTGCCRALLIGVIHLSVRSALPWGVLSLRPLILYGEVSSVPRSVDANAHCVGCEDGSAVGCANRTCNLVSLDNAS